MKVIVKENLIKNMTLLIFMGILHFPIYEYINGNLAIENVGDVLVATSMILVTACFGAFAFTYERINPDEKFHRYWAHITTGILMFIIGISLLLTGFMLEMLMGQSIIIELTLFGLYLGVVCYDFWDLFRLDLVR